MRTIMVAINMQIDCSPWRGSLNNLLAFCYDFSIILSASVDALSRVHKLESTQACVLEHSIAIFGKRFQRFDITKTILVF